VNQNTRVKESSSNVYSAINALCGETQRTAMSWHFLLDRKSEKCGTCYESLVLAFCFLKKLANDSGKLFRKLTSLFINEERHLLKAMNHDKN
jgi:hypothetical protein